MVIESEGLLGRLIVDDDRAKRWIGLKDCNKIESQPAIEISWPGDVVAPDDILLRRAADQLAVIQGGERITFRQARDLRILVVGGDEDVIRVVEHPHQALDHTDYIFI